MSRIYFARGCKGVIAKRIQQDLLRQGVGSAPADRFVDGDFGGNTVAAVQQLQARHNLPATGQVDHATWRQLTTDPLPSVFERCLQLTAWLEGHGFTLAQGNFDGAGLTWGLIGYTLRHGQVQRHLALADQDAPGTLARVFGTLYPELQRMLAMPLAQQVAWADALTLPPRNRGRLAPEWAAAFARLGEEPHVKARQVAQAYHSYFVPAVKAAQGLGLVSELGMALAFDVHVQNGSFKPEVLHKAGGWPTQHSEADRCKDLAHWVADASSNKRFVEDVRARKLCIALGGGPVRGVRLSLSGWGLADAPAA